MAIDPISLIMLILSFFYIITNPRGLARVLHVFKPLQRVTVWNWKIGSCVSAKHNKKIGCLIFVSCSYMKSTTFQQRFLCAFHVLVSNWKQNYLHCVNCVATCFECTGLSVLRNNQLYPPTYKTTHFDPIRKMSFLPFRLLILIQEKRKEKIAYIF